MYDKNNFIVPIETSTTLKIRNVNGLISHIIKEPSCTVKQNLQQLLIKQASESNTIVLDFGTSSNAQQAHILLRTGLQQLLANQTQSNTQTFYSVVITNETTSNIAPGTEIILPINTTVLLNFFVNGVLIEPSNYTFLLLPSRVLWRFNAIYQIESTDIILINYI